MHILLVFLKSQKSFCPKTSQTFIQFARKIKCFIKTTHNTLRILVIRNDQTVDILKVIDAKVSWFYFFYAYFFIFQYSYKCMLLYCFHIKFHSGVLLLISFLKKKMFTQQKKYFEIGTLSFIVQICMSIEQWKKQLTDTLFTFWIPSCVWTTAVNITWI